MVKTYKCSNCENVVNHIESDYVICHKCDSGRPMREIKQVQKTKKDLAKYLADYIEYEIDSLHELEDIGIVELEKWLNDELGVWIAEGLEAFESTGGVVINLQGNP